MGRERSRSGETDAKAGAVVDQLTSLTRLVGLFRREFATRVLAEDWVVESGVRPPTYGLLRVVAHRGPISQREVSELIGVHPTDLVEVIDRAEQAGWVRRDRDPADRRRHQLTLTDRGRAALCRYDAIAAAAEDAVLAPLTPTERERLRALVAKVVDAHGERS